MVAHTLSRAHLALPVGRIKGSRDKSRTLIMRRKLCQTHFPEPVSTGTIQGNTTGSSREGCGSHGNCSAGCTERASEHTAPVGPQALALWPRVISPGTLSPVKTQAGCSWHRCALSHVSPVAGLWAWARAGNPWFGRWEGGSNTVLTQDTS